MANIQPDSKMTVPVPAGEEKASMATVHVLIVENNAVEREGLGVILRAEGYEVTAVGDGAEALDFLRANLNQPPDLILLDMLLPSLDGWHVIDAIGAMPFKRKPDIIIVTGTLVIGKEWVESHGCCAVIRKPVDVNRLLTEVRTCLATRSTN
jgi:two-component system, sensor histidine kinase